MYLVCISQIVKRFFIVHGISAYSRCIKSEDKVTSLDRLVARKAGFEQRRVRRFAVFELSKPPTTRRSVFLGVLDHKLNVRGGSGHERLGAAKDFVVFLGRNVTPGRRAMIVPSGNGDLPS